jgi:PEP-CTERM motif
MKKVSLGILFIAVSLLGATSAFADGIAGSCPCDMGFDENGNGFVNAEPEAGILAPDPGPGGLAAVLTYALPFDGVAGDVGLTAAEGTFDYLRFNGNGTLVFYSDNTDGTDAIGDTASPPASFYANLIFIPEVGPEGGNGAIYVPTAGQPGFNNGGDQYVILSDGVLTVPPIPEPSTLMLFGSGIVAMAGHGLRRLKKGARDRKERGEGGSKKNARV